MCLYVNCKNEKIGLEKHIEKNECKRKLVLQN